MTAELWVLVVDDEPPLRRLLRLVLESEGYRVLEAAHGQEALDRLADAAGRVRLVVSDLVMPVMDGHQLWRSLQRDSPTLPLLFISGHAQEELRERYGAGGMAVPFLRKPFTPDELVGAIRDLLRLADGDGVAESGRAV